MSKQRYRLAKYHWFITPALSLVLFVGAAGAALAQTSPKLSFLNGALTTRAEGNREALQDCPSDYREHVETATATVFVLLSSSTEGLANIEFVPEVQSVASAQETSTSYNQIVDQNQILAQWRAAEPNQGNTTIGKSEVKPFNIRFLICSSSEPPGWWYYVWHNDIPVEWSNLTGQLIVRDSVDKEVTAGTISMQLNRPALGYEQTYFIVIIVIAALLALVFARWMNRDIDDKRKLRLEHSADFKTTFVAPLTTATAILGTVLTTTILPTDTFFMPRGEYATLNVLFGLIVIVAAVVHNRYDTARSFLIAAALTLAAAGGEVITVLFVLKEMGFQGSIPAQIVWIFQLLLAVLGVILILMVRKMVVSEINKKKLPIEWPLELPPPIPDAAQTPTLTQLERQKLQLEIEHLKNQQGFWSRVVSGAALVMPVIAFVGFWFSVYQSTRAQNGGRGT